MSRPLFRPAEAETLTELLGHIATHPVIEWCVITASRTYARAGTMRAILECLPSSTRLRHGAARGGDRLAGQIWVWLGRELTEYPVTAEQWRLTRRAGHLRNQLMLEGRAGEPRADICLEFNRDHSAGAADCAARARLLDIPTFTFPYTTGA